MIFKATVQRERKFSAKMESLIDLPLFVLEAVQRRNMEIARNEQSYPPEQRRVRPAQHQLMA